MWEAGSHRSLLLFLRNSLFRLLCGLGTKESVNKKDSAIFCGSSSGTAPLLLLTSLCCLLVGLPGYNTILCGSHYLQGNLDTYLLKPRDCCPPRNYQLSWEADGEIRLASGPEPREPGWPWVVMLPLGTHVVGQPGSLRPPTGQSQWWGKRRAMVRICDRDRAWGGAGPSCLLLVTSLSKPQDLGFPSAVG